MQKRSVEKLRMYMILQKRQGNVSDEDYFEFNDLYNDYKYAKQNNDKSMMARNRDRMFSLFWPENKYEIFKRSN